MKTQTESYGADVSKEKLDIARDGKVVEVENTKAAVKAFIKGMPAGSMVAMEATDTYHLLLADECYKAGMRVYVVNPRITRHYREVQGLRGHNDRMDARALAGFIEKEHDGLREYMPKTKDQRKLQTLIRRRSKLVGVKTQLRLSLGALEDVKREYEALVSHLDALVAAMERQIDKLLCDDKDRERIAQIPGIGRIVSAALTADLRAASFVSADAFVAFYGLDPKPDQSGKRRGRGRLSKQGHKLGRTLLYNAAMAASMTKVWAPVYKACLERGLSKIEALVVIARKLARTVWSIYTHKTTFDPMRLSRARP